jgi:hypothetical protein
MASVDLDRYRSIYMVPCEDGKHRLAVTHDGEPVMLDHDMVMVKAFEAFGAKPPNCLRWVHSFRDALRGLDEALARAEDDGFKRLLLQKRDALLDGDMELWDILSRRIGYQLGRHR